MDDRSARYFVTATKLNALGVRPGRTFSGVVVGWGPRVPPVPDESENNVPYLAPKRYKLAAARNKKIRNRVLHSLGCVDGPPVRDIKVVKAN